MNVHFTSIEDFLADLAAELQAEGERVDDRIVRVETTRAKPNETTSEVSLAAGFTSLGELRQLALFCGCDYAPETAGSDAAVEMTAEIERFCGAHDLTVRGGRFDHG